MCSSDLSRQTPSFSSFCSASSALAGEERARLRQTRTSSPASQFVSLVWAEVVGLAGPSPISSGSLCCARTTESLRLCKCLVAHEQCGCSNFVGCAHRGDAQCRDGVALQQRLSAVGPCGQVCHDSQGCLAGFCSSRSFLLEPPRIMASHPAISYVQH